MLHLIKICLVLIFATNALQAETNTTNPSEGSTLQVLAPSGLKLRSEPNLQSGTLAVMPHGATVKLLAFEASTEMTRINWIDGHWIQVEYDGQVGWAFDGFLTILNVPESDLEKCYEDLQLIYPVEYWTRSNYVVESVDTLTDEQTFHTSKYQLSNDQMLKLTETELSTNLELYLKDVRVMELYQLLQSMIVGKSARKAFQDASVFIEKDGTVKHIKVDINGGIDIREIYDGRVRIIMHQFIDCK